MADNIAVLDAAEAAKTMKTKDVAGVHTPAHALTAADGATLINPATSEGLATLAGYLDGLEGLITAGNALLTTANGYLDGLETLIGSGNTLLTAQNGYLDGVEAAIGSTNTKLDTAIGHVDGVETAIASTNTKLDSVIAAVDGVEALLTAQNAAQEYETVAAGQTAQVLGATGAAGDELVSLLIVPTTLSPGVVTILDNAISINVFAGGADSLSNLVPFIIPIGLKSVSGAWKVTTGAGLSVLAAGNFT